MHFHNQQDIIFVHALLIAYYTLVQFELQPFLLE